MAAINKVSPKDSPGKQSSLESRAIYAAFAGGVVGLGIGLLSFWGNDISLFSRNISLGYDGSILGGAVAFATFLIVSAAADHAQTQKSRWQRIKAILGTWSLALVHGLLIFLCYTVLFFIVSQSFKDARIDMWAASGILALSTGFAAYIVYLSASAITAVRVSMLLATFLLSGTFISMLTASDPHWWYLHFSSLGAGGGVSGYAFNVTLIIAGLVVMALAGYITNDFNQLKQQGTISRSVKVGVLQGLLTGIGMMLAFVGLFIYNVYPAVHNVSAGGMALMFLAIVILLPILTPGFTKAFFIASYALLGTLLACVWLYLFVHYLNLTVFELLAAAIIFTWLVVFVRHVAAMLDDEKAHKILHKGAV